MHHLTGTALAVQISKMAFLLNASKKVVIIPAEITVSA